MPSTTSSRTSRETTAMAEELRDHVVFCICDDLRFASVADAPFGSLASAVADIVALCEGTDPLSLRHRQVILGTIDLYASEIANRVCSGTENGVGNGIDFQALTEGLVASRWLIDRWTCPPALRLPRHHPDTRDAKDRARILESSCEIESWKGAIAERRQARRDTRNREIVAEVAATLGVAIPEMTGARR